MKLLLILVFGLLSTVRGQESKPVEHLLFRAKTPLSEAVKAFNEKFSQELGKLNTGLLTEDEVRCAFAIGSSFYHYSENNEMAGLCLACYKNGQLPAGSSLALYT